MRGTWAHEVDFSIELGAPPPSEEWIKGQLYKSIADYCQEFYYLLNCSLYPTSRYHTNFMLSIFSYMFVETHKTSGRFLYRKTAPASCYGNRGGLLRFMRFSAFFQTLTQLRTGVIQARNHRLFEIAVAYHFTSLSFWAIRYTAARVLPSRTIPPSSSIFCRIRYACGGDTRKSSTTSFLVITPPTFSQFPNQFWQLVYISLTNIFCRVLIYFCT